MADQNSNLKSIEMRLAEVEDKLSKMHITEEEMKAYQKVSALLGTPAAAATPQAMSAGTAQLSTFPCVIYQCITPRIFRQFCYECYCGPCNVGGGTFGSGGFGGLG